MKLTRWVCMLFSICLGTACASGPQSEQLDPTATAYSPTPATSPTASAVFTPQSPGEYLLRDLPRCGGIEVLDQPVQFAWPNVELRLQELEEADWGYYACPQPQAEVSTFYREKLPEPPFLMTETNWVEREQGTLGVYYHSVSQLWTYLWVVPQPSNAQAAYVILAQIGDLVFRGGDCHLINPPKQGELVWFGMLRAVTTQNRLYARQMERY